MYEITQRLLLALLLAGSLTFVACTESTTEEGAEDDTATEQTDEQTNDATDGQFVSEMGRFSVTFPGDVADPEMQSVPVPTDVGNIDMNMYLVDQTDYAYMTAFADYPAALVDAVDDTKMLLDMGRDGALANVSGTLISERDYEKQGYPAKEFYGKGMQGDQEIFIRANIMMVNERLYQVLYLSFDQDDLDSKSADDYVASFSFDEVPPASAEEAAEDAADVAKEEEAK